MCRPKGYRDHSGPPLRGDQRAAEALEEERTVEVLHASEITRLEVLAGMRPAEEAPTHELLSTFLASGR